MYVHANARSEPQCTGDCLSRALRELTRVSIYTLVYLLLKRQISKQDQVAMKNRVATIDLSNNPGNKPVMLLHGSINKSRTAYVVRTALPANKPP